MLMSPIEIDVRDFRGIAHAELSCAPISLLVAPNAGGKSSIAQAVAAVLTGNALARQFELTGKTAGALIRPGAKDARCILKNGTGEARMSWPECQLSTTGAEPPRASTFAAGIESIPLLAPKDR